MKHLLLAIAVSFAAQAQAEFCTQLPSQMNVKEATATVSTMTGNYLVVIKGKNLWQLPCSTTTYGYTFTLPTTALVEVSYVDYATSKVVQSVSYRVIQISQGRMYFSEPSLNLLGAEVKSLVLGKDPKAMVGDKEVALTKFELW